MWIVHVFILCAIPNGSSPTLMLRPVKIKLGPGLRRDDEPCFAESRFSNPGFQQPNGW
jgi:hypothetical protein